MFNEWDAVKTKSIGDGLQVLNYDYYANGFLEGINDVFIPGGLSTTSSTVPTSNSIADLYRMKLNYDEIGNISTWQSQNRSYALETNTYSYDGLNRILTNTSSSNNFSQTFTYEDLIGNIGTISRYDLVVDNSTWQKRQIDDLDFTYLNNKSSRIQHIVDATNHEKGYKPNNENYGYDGNGNMTYDPQQQITTVYNYLNLTTKMTKPSGSKLVNIYDATGKKWQQIEYDAANNKQKRSYIGDMEFLGNTIELTHHSDGFVRNKNAAADEILVLTGDAGGDQKAKKITSTETVNTVAALTYKADESIILKSGFEAKAGSDLHLTIEPIATSLDYEWQYRIADHLGNTRVLFADKDNDGLIKQSDDETNELLGFYNYSAFGLELGGSHLNASNSLNRYTYNGKEEIGFSGYLDYGWRMFDRSIGRFTGVDPISDEFAWASTYNYAENRPINGIDLHGLQYLNFNNVNQLSPDLQYEHHTAGLQYPIVNYNGGQYYNVGSHLNDSNGNRITEWVYTDVDNFDATTDHVFTWGDPTLTGNNVFGSPRNTNCADLACAQAEELGTDLENGLVSYNSMIEVYNAENNTLINSDEALDYIHSQLESGNAVVAGVHDGDLGGTDTRGTDHYVTIVGRSSQNNTGYFYFLENAVPTVQRSTNFAINRITPGTGNSNLGGRTIWQNRTLETTRVQRNQ